MTSPRMTWLSGGNVGNRNVTAARHYDVITTKKSCVRLSAQLLSPALVMLGAALLVTFLKTVVNNFQEALRLPSLQVARWRIPDPTSINLQEKLIKVPIQRQHPYESHISRFALFPTPCCPDDADTGVRAAVRPSTYPLVPVHPPHITVLSKTKGAPYRHEVHSLSREEALTWPGQHGFYHHPRSTESTNQGLYPTPPKAVHPNPTLWPWSTTLSERTARMLCNVERSHWVTSHQLDFTGTDHARLCPGCGPMNPLKLDDFHEKTVAVAAGADPHTVQLERSHPVFTPSRPMAGHKQRIREGQQFLQYPYLPTFQPDGCIDQVSIDSAGGVTVQEHQEESHKRRPVTSDITGTGKKQAGKVGNKPVNLRQPASPSAGVIGGRLWSAPEHSGERPMTHSSFSGRLPCSSPTASPRGFMTPPSRSRSTLLELQDSFSKTEAHRQLQQATESSPVDLRDAIRTGKRRCFHGFHSYCFHT
ncbi:hypothetical protein GN956_G9596 [Arapaima gigas]